ncbi:MAG: DUF86 domain-containing protein [Actinobacteria bacterium]|nr:DUF86 domain-containing protein [Actinomycetota bacterium]
MGNKLIHDYFEVDIEIICETIIKDIPYPKKILLQEK